MNWLYLSYGRRHAETTLEPNQHVPQRLVVRIIQTTGISLDVVKYLGAADSVSFGDGGHEQWTYSYAHASAKAASFIPVVGLFADGQNVDKKSLTILFNDSGVARKYTYAASSGDTALASRCEPASWRGTRPATPAP